MRDLLLPLLYLSSLVAATTLNSYPFASSIHKRHHAPNETFSNPLEVDLGYSIYRGHYNDTNNVNIWQGIRFAEPPVGSLRWQSPQPPSENRSEVIQATAIPNQCPQALPNVGDTSYNLAATVAGGSEDCLFLSVYAPPNANKLPILVWIHGGGYGIGNGQQDLGPIIYTNNGSFIGISIQYRLGAFGFLSSDEVDRFGSVNAGIRDQTFALQWVQAYAHLFGGDGSRVTISGISAGAGSVMLQAMAFGGELGTTLFENAIVASPFLPMQYDYNAWVPSQTYYAFANAAGCLPGYGVGSPAASQTIFQCLVSQDTEVLINASAVISGSGQYGTWGFLPVTDGKFIQELPSKQLLKKKVNGARILSGNNALEGPLFVPRNITTEDDLVYWIEKSFPLFTNDDVSRLLHYYPKGQENATDDPSAPEFATAGNSGATANDVSPLATGNQQRAYNIYAETTFVCPSYWLAEAYTSPGHSAWKYQYSVPPSLHGSDSTAYFGPAAPNQGPDFVRAFMTIFGNFITLNNPSIPYNVASPQSVPASPLSNITSNTSIPTQPITDWPPYINANSVMINMNQTGGKEVVVPAMGLVGVVGNVTEYVGDGLRNDFVLVDAWGWEGGRGMRCEFWRSVGELVPE